MVADKVQGVNGSRALGRVHGEGESVEVSLPCGARLSVCDRGR